MYKFLLITTLFLFLQCAQTKPPQGNDKVSESPHSTEIQDSIITVQSINFQFENDDDLKKIAQQIGQKRIVMLGEQSHGDGASFALKARLIKFLHKQMGFNVLVFEADFYSLYQASNNNIQPSDWHQIAQENIYAFWAKAPQVEPLWKYINRTQI